MTCAECRKPKPITSYGDGRLLVCAECRTMRGRITSHTDGVYDGADSWDLNPWVWVVEFQHIAQTGEPTCSR